MSGDEDFFSVARTTPFVAAGSINVSYQIDMRRDSGATFDSQRGNSLVYCVQGIFCVLSVVTHDISPSVTSYQSEPVYHCNTRLVLTLEA